MTVGAFSAKSFKNNSSSVSQTWERILLARLELGGWRSGHRSQERKKLTRLGQQVRNRERKGAHVGGV